MNRFGIATAAASIALAATQAQAGFFFELTGTPLSGSATGLERYNLYALSDDGEDVIAADLTMSSLVPNGIKFRVLDADGDGIPDTLADRYTPLETPDTTLTTRVSPILFAPEGTLLQSPDPTSSLPVYVEGCTSVNYVGFDSRDPSQYDVGVKAGPDQNGGRGAAILSVVAPLGWGLAVFGTIGSDAPGTPIYPVSAIPWDLPEPAFGCVVIAIAVGRPRRVPQVRTRTCVEMGPMLRNDAV